MLKKSSKKEKKTLSIRQMSNETVKYYSNQKNCDLTFKQIPVCSFPPLQRVTDQLELLKLRFPTVAEYLIDFHRKISFNNQNCSLPLDINLFVNQVIDDVAAFFCSVSENDFLTALFKLSFSSSSFFIPPPIEFLSNLSTF